MVKEGAAHKRASSATRGWLRFDLSDAEKFWSDDPLTTTKVGVRQGAATAAAARAKKKKVAPARKRSFRKQKSMFIGPRGSGKTALLASLMKCNDQREYTPNGIDVTVWSDDEQTRDAFDAVLDYISNEDASVPVMGATMEKTTYKMYLGLSWGMRWWFRSRKNTSLEIKDFPGGHGVFGVSDSALGQADRDEFIKAVRNCDHLFFCIPWEPVDISRRTRQNDLISEFLKWCEQPTWLSKFSWRSRRHPKTLTLIITKFEKALISNEVEIGQLTARDLAFNREMVLKRAIQPLAHLNFLEIIRKLVKNKVKNRPEVYLSVTSVYGFVSSNSHYSFARGFG